MIYMINIVYDCNIFTYMDNNVMNYLQVIYILYVHINKY